MEEPAHVGGGRHGFHLLAQIAEGEAVNALQDPALAPLGMALSSSVFSCSNMPRKRKALHLNGGELLVDGAGLEGR